MNSYYFVLPMFVIFYLLKYCLFYSPVESRDIKRKIAAGEITNITELQLNLLMLSYNALMINKSSSVVYSDASNFQFDLQKDCLVLHFFSLKYCIYHFIFIIYLFVGT